MKYTLPLLVDAMMVGSGFRSSGDPVLAAYCSEGRRPMRPKFLSTSEVVVSCFVCSISLWEGVLSVNVLKFL